VYAYARNGKKDANGLKQVEVTSGVIVEKAVAVGQIQPRQKFQVKSKISGIVRRALVQVGDTVKAGEPSTITEMMAAAWAGEMLHIAFYARGISLPHHQRADFQQEWHVMATELGFPNLAHDDGDESPRGGGRSIVIGSESEQRRPWRGRH